MGKEPDANVYRGLEGSRKVKKRFCGTPPFFGPCSHFCACGVPHFQPRKHWLRSLSGARGTPKAKKSAWGCATTPWHTPFLSLRTVISGPSLLGVPMVWPVFQKGKKRRCRFLLRIFHVFWGRCRIAAEALQWRIRFDAVPKTKLD